MILLHHKYDHQYYSVGVYKIVGLGMYTQLETKCMVDTKTCGKHVTTKDSIQNALNSVCGCICYNKRLHPKSSD